MDNKGIDFSMDEFVLIQFCFATLKDGKKKHSKKMLNYSFTSLEQIASFAIIVSNVSPN